MASDNLASDNASGRAALATRLLAAIDDQADRLVGLSLDIHDHPETAYEETYAYASLTDFLKDAGFTIIGRYGGLDTAFRAEIAGVKAYPTIAFLAEYDALPQIGHGCGHNLIAMMAAAAAVGLRAVIADLPGRVVVIGTPAEEGGGGKVRLIEAGAFGDIDVAMLVHPSSSTMAKRATLAANRIDLEFFGKAAHAAAQPHNGISALDGMLQTFNAVNALRLRLKPDARIHGIITAGGTAANVIPDYAMARFSVRALDKSYLEDVVSQFLACAEGGALATGSKLKVTVQRYAAYENLVPSTPVAARWRDHMEQLGYAVNEPRTDEPLGSTDMGNVSQILPTIQPYLEIGPPPLPHHSQQFRDAARTDRAHEAAISAAKAMALTALDLLVTSDLMTEAEYEFAAQVAGGEVVGKT